MKLSEILDEIDKDSVIDQTALDSEALRIPGLHSKYYRILMNEIQVLKGMDAAMAILRRERTDYYLGRASDEVYAANPLHQKVLKVDLDMYMASDPMVNELLSKRDMQKAKCEAIEAFIKTISNRSFLIQSAIQWRRFQAGLA